MDRALNVFGVLVSEQFSKDFFFFLVNVDLASFNAKGLGSIWKCFPVTHPQQPASMDLLVQSCIHGHRKTLEHLGNIANKYV